MFLEGETKYKTQKIRFLLILIYIRQAERALNLTFSNCLHLVDLNNPRILMTHDKMAVTANIRA